MSFLGDRVFLVPFSFFGYLWSHVPTLAPDTLPPGYPKPPEGTWYQRHPIPPEPKKRMVLIQMECFIVKCSESHLTDCPVRFGHVICLYIYRARPVHLFLKSVAYYRPQTKFAKVIFLHLSFCSQGGVAGVLQVHTRGGGWKVWPGWPPDPHSGGFQAHTRGVCVQRGGSQHALSQTPSPQADGYCSGRYASYWNAFL